MRKKKNPVSLLDEIDFSELEQENINFPALCKFIRNTLNVTQGQMADKLGITLRAYSFWEEGRYVPKSWQAFKLCLIYSYAKEYVAKKDSSQDEISSNASPQEEKPQNQAA